ncbi:MAG: spore cortex biosynthesis protein YabQ [Hespellia sp.]|nr:spore cortex biosynthesis protein YabQ [Hespellia sp.]
MYGIGKELAVFVCAVLSGALVALSYEILCLFRKLVKHHLLSIGMEDFFFGIATGVYLFFQMFRTSYGSIRWYFVLGIVFGMGLGKSSLKRAGKMMKKILEKRRERL